jgi:hypothetical protein
MLKSEFRAQVLTQAFAIRSATTVFVQICQADQLNCIIGFLATLYKLDLIDDQMIALSNLMQLVRPG